jgi:ATP-binding cassette subfamily B (MDR/TAP) protein 1
MKVVAGFSKGAANAYKEAGHVVVESVYGIRTVQSFSMQAPIGAMFSKQLERTVKIGMRKGFIGGLGLGFSQCILFLSYAMVFYVGALFVEDGILTFDELIRCFFAIAMAATGSGHSSALAADAAKAKFAKRAIFHLIDRVSAIDPSSEDGDKPSAPSAGRIEFRNVTFAYPTRPNEPVLRNFSLVIDAGENTALAGESGCGKSTLIQLLQRFYDPQEGEILLDGKPLPAYNIAWLRRQFGLVPQEPTLFADTIKNNILYGVPQGQVVTDDDAAVTDAASRADAASFIEEFPDKYDTFTGLQGASQLSGGQKQRVAIARVLIRHASVRLLDESTSALDTASERVVQSALDKLIESERKTSIVIAHRLSTIRNADRIVVLSRGRVAEVGSHEQLMGVPEGMYKRLAELQASGEGTAEDALPTTE